MALGLGLGLGLKDDRDKNNASSLDMSPDMSIVPNLHAYKWVDLTHTFDENSLYWPAAVGTTEEGSFDMEVIYADDTDNGYYYASNQFCTPEHGGTHIDSPIHFARDRYTTEQLQLDKMNGPGIVIDITQQTSKDSDYLLSLEDVNAFEEKYGTIPSGSIVMLRTGWGNYYGNRTKYFGFVDGLPKDANNLHFPSYGTDAARLLVEDRDVNVLGIDAPSIDHGPSQSFLVHQLVFDQNIPALENVANLDQLPAVGSWIISMPMKIGSGSGGPARIAALLPS